MSSRFIMPRQGVNGQNLSPADGAQLFFYNVGLTSNKDTYSDAALTTANENPVTADATGLFPEIWLDGNYDSTLKDKNGVQLWGPESVTSFASDDITVNINQGIMDWDTTVTYLAGAVAKSPTTPERYRSLIQQSANDVDTAYSGASWNGTDWGYAGESAVVYATEYGPLQADLEAALAVSLTRKTWLDCSGVEYLIGDQDFIMPAGSRMRNFRLKYTANVAFRGDVGCELLDGFIDGDSIADYGIRDVVATGQGFIRGVIRRIFITGCLISDVRLNGYHWLCQLDRVWCFSQGNSGWGMHIDNFATINNPDISITNCYIDNGNNSGSGYNLSDGNYKLACSSADNVVSPLRTLNAVVSATICGFEQFTATCTITSSQLYMNQCFVSTRDALFTDDSGQRAMFTSAGATITSSVSLNGGIYQNNSSDTVYLIRGNSITPPLFLKIGTDTQRRLGGSGVAIGDYIYQSIGTPSATIARLSYLGETSRVIQFSGIEPTPFTVSTLFDIECSPNCKRHTIPSDCIARMVQWREIGANTAGATTTVDIVVYSSAGVERTRVEAVAIPGVGSSTAEADKREGETILDLALNNSEFIEFEVATAGERAGTGFSISLVIDR